MTEDELIYGYEMEIEYQKRMIDNLGRWFSLFFTITSMSLVLVYFFHQYRVILALGILVIIAGISGMLLFGYGIYKGRLNLQKVIQDLESKLFSLRSMD